jgi:tetratricopeptide (TPR) repeat protein
MARKSRGATIRAAGMACAVMLAFNSGFDVSGHRIGTLFPVILLATLALPSARAGNFSSVMRHTAKFLGAALLAVGLIWILGGSGIPFLPGVQGISPLQENGQAAMKAGRSDEAVAIFERCEKFRPLDWGVHWTLSDWLLAQGKLDPAWREFQASNALLPYLYWTVRQGAEKWMVPSPGRAAVAVLEVIRKAPQGKRAEIYAGFLSKSRDNPRMRAILLNLFPDDPEFEFVRTQQAAPDASNKRLKRLVERTENLSRAPDQLTSPVLRLMLERNQLAEIDAIVAENPRLKRTAWEILFEREIRSNRNKEALDIYFNFAPKPAIPATLNRSDLRSVERAAALAPLDLSTSIAYYQALSGAQRDKEALWQLRHIMELRNAPAYIWFLAAQATHRDGDYEESLKMLRKYREKTKP